jgi:hypothetical protein
MEAITHRSRMTPCPEGADLKNGSLWEAEREREREHTYKITLR